MLYAYNKHKKHANQHYMLRITEKIRLTFLFHCGPSDIILYVIGGKYLSK